MNLEIKDNGFSTKLINIAVLLLCLSQSLNLITYGISQKIFYITGYICILLVLIIPFQKEKKFTGGVGVYLSLSLIFIGIVRLSWVYYVNGSGQEISTNAAGILDGYRLAGKRLFLGAFIVTAIMVWSDKISLKTVGFVKFIMLISMFATLVIGAHEYFNVTHHRIKLTADAASSSSYMVIFIYCAYLWLCDFHRGMLWRTCDVLFIVAAILVMVLCGTRITFIAFLIINLLFIGRAVGWGSVINSKRNIFIGVFLLVALGSLTQSRWMEAINNIDNYHVNSSTPVGARFSIWASGINFIEKNFGFSSPDERTVVARNYIHNADPKNRIAYKNVEYNMHNEFLEVTSLQGGVGLFSLLILYLVVLGGKLKGVSIRGVGMPVSALFITGLTDSVLIYGPTTMVFVTALALCSIQLGDKSQSQDGS